MNGYLEIFNDVVLLATFQFGSRERVGESGRSRPRVVTALRRHIEGPERT